ncbi:NAD-dependent epimerase/dehydratase family protein [Altererythrobacter aurantiacus]|uniref:NAD-dependent epimerase/dehydratase family protein n=1 Tax=Parapontixanthobacter aurantiacus TaxID=1463599 RepID=A0A844ZG89_9SPHN|nr:nucleoside-diphosphate sugar epimerase/dehydratase [Parapontixanthobacter aurantiacus]MXO86778.1 NAD-dependent epimerase/dehydratase family protein [Parapontixanthobacter aurantiacus]
MLNRGLLKILGIASRVTDWPRWIKQLFVAILDGVLAVVATWIAFSLRLGEWRLFDWPVIRFAGSLILIWYLLALIRQNYNTIFRYTGRGSVVSLFVTVFLTTIPLITYYMVYTYPGVPRTIAILAPILFLILMATARIIGRYILVDLLNRSSGEADHRRVLIYGAGATGLQLANSLTSERGMQVMGFIDDDRTKHGKYVNQTRIYHPEDIAATIEQTGSTDIVLAMRTAKQQRRREILEELKDLPVNVQILPAVRAVIEGRVNASAIRPIQVEDLLGRAPVEPNEKLLRASVTGKTVLVTGGGGSIGSEICRQIALLEPKRILVADMNEFGLFHLRQMFEQQYRKDVFFEKTRELPAISYDLINVADANQVRHLFGANKIDTVYHAAAYKHVPLLEENSLSGVYNNVFGTKNVADQALASGVERMILISTDKAVRPPNVMGASKRLCELYLQSLAQERRAKGTIFSMVRFGNVLGSSGSVVPTFREQIEAGGPVTVTHRDVTRFFMTIPEAAQLVIQSAGMAEGGEVYLLDMGAPIKIWDLARTMIQLAGFDLHGDGPHGDHIEIREVGLRSGEKLHEELLIGEASSATEHPRIFRADEDFIRLDELTPILDELERTINDNSHDQCRRLLRTVVPTLNPQEDFVTERRA